jgi:GDP-L-fucose synthase
MSTYDMMEALRREKPDAVVHLAATCGGIGINKDNPGKFIYENLVMGISVLEACRNFRYVNNQIHNPLAKKDTPRVVFLGTVCQYPKFTPVPFKEEELWNGYPEETNAPYGIAKRAVMEMGIAYNKQYELEVVNFLPVNMAGEYDNFNLYSSHVIPALIRKFEEAGKHEPVELWGTGSASREFLYAGDTAKAIRKAIEGPYVGPEPMNLGTGREITIKDLAERIKEVGGYSSSILWDDTKPDGQPRRCLDTTQATERLGWTAETDIDEMLSRTIHWYRENKDA